MRSFDPDSVVLNDYGSLDPGTSLSGQLCPKCEGGNSGERSFSVTVEEWQIKFICHRNSCGYKGITPRLLHSVPSRRLVESGRRTSSHSSNELSQDSVQKSRRDSNSYRNGGLSTPLTGGSAASEVCSLYGISMEVAKSKGLTEVVLHGRRETEPRLVIPLSDWLGNHWGNVLRATSKDQLPKAINEKLDPDANGLAWFPNPDTNILIVVEDVFSAIRLSKYVNSCSLQGTNLSPEGAKELEIYTHHLSEGRPPNGGLLPELLREDGSSGLLYREPQRAVVHLALDKDAFQKAIETCYKYKMICPSLVPLFIPKDFKNMGEEELLTFLEENVGYVRKS